MKALALLFILVSTQVMAEAPNGVYAGSNKGESCEVAINLETYSIAAYGADVRCSVGLTKKEAKADYTNGKLEKTGIWTDTKSCKVKIKFNDKKEPTEASVSTAGFFGVYTQKFNCKNLTLVK